MEAKKGIVSPLEDLHDTSTFTVDPAVSKEQKALEIFFTHLGNLDFDAAKAHFERDRESFRMSSSGHVWSKLVSELARLSITERQYHQLEFLKETSWFTRREGLKDSYSTLLNEITKLGDVYGAQKGGMAPGWERKMASLCSVLGVYVRARRDLMEVYNDIQSQTIDITTIEAKAVQILPRVNISSTGLLDPLKESLIREVQILSCLLSCNVQISNWHFLPAMISLRSCKQKLMDWHGIPQEDRGWAKRSTRAGFSLGKSAHMPALYTWLCKFYSTLLSKVSFFFYQTLSEQCPAADMKATLAKADFDIVGKLANIRRRSDLLLIALVFDSRGCMPPFSGHGYTLPSNTPEPAVGLASYPAVLAFPQDYPKSLWPSLISLLQEHQARLSGKEHNTVKFFDPAQTGRFYFLGKTDPRFYLVAVFSGRKVERDSSVMAVLNEVLSYLRLAELIAQLKAG